MNATRHDLEVQFRRVQSNGWLPSFQREAIRAGITTARLLALGSRETNLQDIKGDYRNGRYHGFSILQVDVGTDPEYCRTWTPGKVEHGIVRGVDIYLGKVSQMIHHVGQRQLIGGKSFIGKAVEHDDLHRIATAAYNCGLWAYYHFSRGENVDSTTTGHDYSRDVYDRAMEFADILEKGGIEPDAVDTERDAQGKYARGYIGRVQLPAAEPQEAEDELSKVDYQRDQPEDSAAVTPMPEPQLPPDGTINTGALAPAPFDSLAGQPVTPPPTTQNADTIVNTGDVAPPTPPTTEETVAAPLTANSVGKASAMTIGGFGVPAFLVGIVTAIKSAFENGFINAAEVGSAILNFITSNTKYAFGLIGLVIVLLTVKHVTKNITLWFEMHTKSRNDLNSVTVVKQ